MNASHRIVKALIANKYHIYKSISFKSDAEVYIVKNLRCSEGRFQVMKKTSSKSKETKILKKLRGLPYILQLEDVIFDRYLTLAVTEFHRCGTLVSLLKLGKLSEEHVRFYISELIVAIDGIHKAGVLHLDLKPQNVLLSSEGHVVLADFGLSVIFDAEDIPASVIKLGSGTSRYKSPEVISGFGVSQATDWWGLGVICYLLLTGCLPFAECQPDRSATLDDTPKYPSCLSSDCVDFLKQLFCKYTKSRLGAYGAEDLKEHPFLDDIDWTAVEENRINPPIKLDLEPLPEETTNFCSIL